MDFLPRSTHGCHIGCAEGYYTVGMVGRDGGTDGGTDAGRVRFGGERWLYLVLLLKFQSGVDRAMAVRMLTYSGLLYQRLVGEGVLRERVLIRTDAGSRRSASRSQGRCRPSSG